MAFFPFDAQMRNGHVSVDTRHDRTYADRSLASPTVGCWHHVCWFGLEMCQYWNDANPMVVDALQNCRIDVYISHDREFPIFFFSAISLLGNSESSTARLLDCLTAVLLRGTMCWVCISETEPPHFFYFYLCKLWANVQREIFKLDR